MQKIIPFQLRLVEEVNTNVKVAAAQKNITKHDWVQLAINEKLERDKAVS
jgi:predicted HicB family RNase H-like nuclease